MSSGVEAVHWTRIFTSLFSGVGVGTWRIERGPEGVVVTTAGWVDIVIVVAVVADLVAFTRSWTGSTFFFRSQEVCFML